MNILLQIAFLFTLFTGLCLWFYWAVFFPCIVLKSRFEIQKVSDDVQIAVREGRMSSESRGFIELQYFLDVGRRAVRHADLLMLSGKKRSSQSDFEEIERRASAIRKDSPEVQEAFMTSARWMIAIWLAARPMHLVFLGPLLVLAVFSDWAKKRADREQKGVFVVASGLPA